jgi:hypothetical protein
MTYTAMFGCIVFQKKQGCLEKIFFISILKITL